MVDERKKCFCFPKPTENEASDKYVKYVSTSP